MTLGTADGVIATEELSQASPHLRYPQIADIIYLCVYHKIILINKWKNSAILIY